MLSFVRFIWQCDCCFFWEDAALEFVSFSFFFGLMIVSRDPMCIFHVLKNCVHLTDLGIRGPNYCVTIEIYRNRKSSSFINLETILRRSMDAYTSHNFFQF